MKLQGELTELNGLPVLMVNNVPVPGPQGPMGPPGLDGMDGIAPTAEEVVEQLKSDNEFLRSVVENKKWVFSVQRDSMGLITKIIAESDY